MEDSARPWIHDPPRCHSLDRRRARRARRPSPVRVAVAPAVLPPTTRFAPLVPADVPGPAAHHRGRLSVVAGRVGVGQRLLLGRRAGRRQQLAMLFGSFDASNAITVDKPPAALWIPELLARVIGVNSWSVLVPEALDGRGHRGPRGGDGQAVVQQRRRPVRRRRDGVHARGRVDVPFQQPRRAARADAHRRRLRGGAGARGRAHPLDGAGRLARGVRLPGQDDAGVRGDPGAGPGVPGGRAATARPAHQADRGHGRGDHRRRWLVGGPRGAVAVGQPPVHRWLAAQQRARAEVRLQRPRSPHGQRDRFGRRRRRHHDQPLGCHRLPAPVQP